MLAFVDKENRMMSCGSCRGQEVTLRIYTDHMFRIGYLECYVVSREHKNKGVLVLVFIGDRISPTSSDLGLKQMALAAAPFNHPYILVP